MSSKELAAIERKIAEEGATAEEIRALVKQMVYGSPQYRKLLAKALARDERRMAAVRECMELSRDLERLTRYYNELVGLGSPVDSALDTLLAALEGY